jgi:hypothetical protein
VRISPSGTDRPLSKLKVARRTARPYVPGSVVGFRA